MVGVASGKGKLVQSAVIGGSHISGLHRRGGPGRRRCRYGCNIGELGCIIRVPIAAVVVVVEVLFVVVGILDARGCFNEQRSKGIRGRAGVVAEDNPSNTENLEETLFARDKEPQDAIQTAADSRVC